MSAAAPPVPPARSRKKLALGVAVLAILGGVLLVPALIYGGFTVPVRVVAFGEATGSLSEKGSAQVTVQTVTVYEYLFIIKTGGMVRTSESNMSSSGGTANITMTLKLTNPSGQTVELGNLSMRGAIGTRTHTVYLGVDEGVRVPGDYKLDVTIRADVSPVGLGVELGLTLNIVVNFTVS